jgi:hypothetical protein
MRMIKAWLAALALMGSAAGLAGCNLVVSPTPVFTAADARGAPPLRPGVWAAMDPDCKFDDKAPAADWPQCAQGAVINATDGWSPDKKADSAPYVLAAGDPRVLQTPSPVPTGSQTTKTLYFFLAVNPLARDAQGRIVKVEVWFIQCGPPPPKAKPDAPASDKPDDANVTREPLPGMKIDGGLCTPTDKAAVRHAAKASRARAQQPAVLRWVRDGEK